MNLAISSKTGLRPLYVYMQRPDTAQWLTVGAYWFDQTNSLGRFKYALSFEEAGHEWVIDPVNLVRKGPPGEVYTATRYQGLHDVLRDACPDSWGQAVLKKTHGLSGNPSPLTYLKIASNADRWGALAVGATPKPSVAALATPRLPKLDAVVRELHAMAARKPAVDVQLRLIGAPIEDRIELFERIVFNALCGNDDDHLRNHAAFFQHEERTWRLSPAFDVVPNPDATPTHLALGVDRHDKRISKANVLNDATLFGFDCREAAQLHLKQFLARARAAFDDVQDLLDGPLRKLMKLRMQENLKLLK